MWYYNLMHSIGLHSYELPALVITIASAISLLSHNRKQKKREEEFEKKHGQAAAEK